eukprot:tig00021318_g20148.t1
MGSSNEDKIKASLKNLLPSLPDEKTEALWTSAAEKGDVAKIKELLVKAKEISAGMEHHPEALVAAVRNGHIEVVKLLGFPDARYWHAERVKSKTILRWMIGHLKEKTPYEDLIRRCKMGNFNACFMFAKAALDAASSATESQEAEDLQKLANDCIEFAVKLLDEQYRTTLYKASHDPQAQVELLLMLEFQIGTRTTLDMANELNATQFLSHPLVNLYINLSKGEEGKEHAKRDDDSSEWIYWAVGAVALLSIAIALYILFTAGASSRAAPPSFNKFDASKGFRD